MVLLRFFAPLCQKYYQYHDLKGDHRKLIRYEERTDSSLPGAANKLLFILTYMKENPNQAYHGALFCMSQSKVSQWIQQLSPLLQEALKRMDKLPAREADRFYHYLCACIEVVMLMDVTERRIGRSGDYQVQKWHYSAKKGCHTLKNLLITTLQGKVIYLGETFEGSKHDKAVYDQANLIFPDQLHCLWTDLGFLGIEAEGVKVLMPDKKPKGKQLTDYQRWLNGMMASIRVKVEHTIAGIKRVKIIRNQIRLHGWQARDRMMNIACGLHNLRCQRWVS